MVNQSAIDSVGDNSLIIQKKTIPVSKAYKADVNKRLNLI